ncbi:preprotein translocase subunit SecG [Breznakibacter xylanolyticus]|uniref:Protein-export membrane protein SecG n=1 Tax=Breznakibacter xylanolyticus TaxID=990 RepID=A0A2W7NJL6_9BACT|nr:preprotein translocase subunit SecG [Breznakibacter xylanolyticus]MBN2744220.1 preprotein translocase subunit SecG [Marinilabiliaceae bacterium]PZX20635.1 preprotein translocase subunit SecG [Breznakibacter xylanolyticus]
MTTFISVLVVLVSIFMILIVLVQNSKGGGLASNFASSNQVMGVRKTTDFLEKATWTLAGIILVLSFVSVATLGTTDAEQSNLDKAVETVAPVTTPNPAFQVAEPAAENAEQQPAE